MASDVRVTLGANLEVTTTGVDAAKRQAAEVQKATEDVGTSARDAGDAVTEAMGAAADAAARAAEAAKRAAEASTRPTPDRTFPGHTVGPAATPTLPTREASGASLAYDPKTHAYRAQNMLYGIEASLAGGVTTEAQQRQLEARAGKAGFYVDAAREGGLPDQQLDSLIEHLQNVADALDENREAIKESSRAGALAAPDPGGDNAGLQAMTDELRRLASGGLGSMGVFGRFLGRAGLVGLGVGAAVGAVNMFTRMLTGSHAEGREQVVALADLARQYDTDEQPTGWFRQQEGKYAGFTTEDLQRIGFSATDATAFMARLDLPGGAAGLAAPMRDTTAGLTFARATGIDEGNVADLLRTLGLGGIERGESERALVLIREAMREGVKEGVSASDTFRNLEQALGGIFRGGVNLTETGLSFQAGLLTTLARTGDRQWQGDQGAANLERWQTAMLGGGDLAMQLALFQQAGPFTAADLGIEDEDKARTYDRIAAADPFAAMQFAIDLAPMSAQVMERMGDAFDTVFGEDNVHLKSYFFRSMGLTGDAGLTALGLNAGDVFREAAEAGEDLGDQPEGGFADPQAANRLAATTLSVRIIEMDQQLAASITSLDKLGGIEETMRLALATAQDVWRRILNLAPGEGPGLWSTEPAGPPAPAGSVDHGRTWSQSPEEAAAYDATLQRPARRDEGSLLDRALGTAANWVSEHLLGRVVHQESGGRPGVANERTGAFGLTQIMPSNLMGGDGWDREFMARSPNRAHWRDVLTAHGLDPDDPIPDAIAAQGGDAIVTWRAGLDPESRGALDEFLLSLSDEKLAEYINTATSSGMDPFTARVAALATWYGGPGHGYLTDSTLMNPANPFFRRRHGEDKNEDGIPDEPSHMQYVEDILGPLKYNEDGTVQPADSGSLAPQRMDITVRVEGLDTITIAGVTDEHGNRIASAFRGFLEAAANPASFRGA